MATDQLQTLVDVHNEHQRVLQAEYGGKMSNQFVEEMKSSTLFQCDWGELLSAAPTALSLMGACWIAASQAKADSISLAKAQPKGGWKYLKNYDEPTLRSCLVDVCNNGGREAFAKASANMDALRVISQRIVDDECGRIRTVFERLGACTQSAEKLEDFNDALETFAKESRTCAKLATEIRVAFNTWGKMVGELHASTEQKKGLTSIESESTMTESRVTEIEKVFAEQNVAEAKTAVENASTRLKNNEKRLDRAIENVPSPWATVIQTAVTGAVQAVPAIVAGVLPAVLQASNPGAAIAGALGGALNKSNQPVSTTATGAGGSGNAPQTVISQSPTTLQQSVLDPAYASAATVKPILDTFYEFLGGEKGEIDWDKLSDAPPAATEGSANSKPLPQGVTFVLGNLNGLKSATHATETEPSKALMAAFEKATKAATSIKEVQKSQTDLNSEKASDTAVASWKSDVKLARDTTLALSTTASSNGSTNIPSPFANLKIEVPKTDLSAQSAASSNAMQGVQIAQQAVDVAQDKYDEYIAKQAKTAAAMNEVEKKLKKLQETGQLLDNIKAVLRDCISVLVDLTIQIGKLEKFFTVLTTVIDNIILVRAEEFKLSMTKAGRRSFGNGVLNIDDLDKQTIYVSTLQMKAYFSLLVDISTMYTSIDRSHITKGVNLCTQLSKSAASKETSAAVQDELATYTESAAKAVAVIVNTKQEEILKDLKARAQRAAMSTKMLEDTLAKRGLPVDQSAKQAITQGAQAVKDEAKAILNSTESATARAQKSENKAVYDY